MEKKKYITLMFVGLFFCEINLQAQSLGDYRDKNIDSLEWVLANHPPAGAELLRIYSDLSSYYTRNYNPEKNREYALKGIDLARRLNDYYGIVLLHNNLGSAYDDLSQPDSSIIYYEMAFRLIEEMESKKMESERNIAFLKGTTHSYIGNLYNMQGFSDKAVEHYLDAISLFEKFDVTDKLAKVFRNISLVYVNMGNYEQAEYYLNKGVEINNVLQDSLGLASTLTRLGHIYFNQFRYPEALQCAEDAEKIYVQYAEKRDLRIYNLRVLSAVWHNGFMNEQESMGYARKALEESKVLGIKLEISRSLQLLAALHLGYKRYYQANQTAIEALQTDSSNLTNNILLYESLTMANAGMGDLAKAQDYFNLFQGATTTYSNQNFQSSLSEMEVKYETEKKNLRIQVLEGKNRLMTGLIAACGGMLLLSLTALFFFVRWIMQKKRLTEKQKELAEQQVKQLEQEKQLVATQAVLDGEVQERTRIARDLHDGLGSILAAAKYNLADIKKTSIREAVEMERFDKAINLLDESMREMRRVAHHLMPESLSSLGLKQSIDDFCNSVPCVHFNYYGDERRLDTKMEVMVYRIMHELVSNALKHASASCILVQIVKEPDRIALTVQDDGCGFDPSTVSKGMGLDNIRMRVAAYNGNLLVDSKSGVGTEINVELTINN